MKKIFSIFCIFCVSCVFNVSKACAQMTDRRNDLAIGVNGGVLMNSLNFQPTIKQNQKLSGMVGLSGRYVCEKYFKTICAVQAELNFALLGWKENIETSDETYSRTMPYIQLPLLMQMGWGKEQHGCKFIFEAGPQFGLSLGSTEHKSDPFTGQGRPNGVNMQYGKEADNIFDYGITGGIGLEIAQEKTHLIISARYYYGLADIYDNSKKGDFSRSANQTIMLKVAYLCDL